MTEIKKAIEENYAKWLARVEKFVPVEAAGDVLHEILLDLMERGAGNIEKLENYIMHAAKISYISPNSPYSRKFQRHINFVPLEDLGGEIGEPEAAPMIDVLERIEETKNISWWERELFKRKILENKTFKELAKELNLTISQVDYSYKKAKRAIRNNIENK